jgi:hypothetical protein
MERLQQIDSATMVDGPQGTIWWAPNTRTHKLTAISLNIWVVYEVLVEIFYLGGTTVVPIIHCPM